MSGPPSLPYVFPYEDAFAVFLGALIVGLLALRFHLSRRRRDGTPPES